METTENNTWTSDLTGEVYSNDVEKITTYCGQVATLAELQDTNYDFRFSERDREWYYYEDCNWCYDVDDYAHVEDTVYIDSMDECITIDNATYCDDCDTWYYNRQSNSCPDQDCQSNVQGESNEELYTHGMKVKAPTI